jgi:hypothetical protein
MSAGIETEPRSQALLAGLVAFAAYHLALACFMAFAPHAFYSDVGPFGALNVHYIRDTASFEGALAFGFLAATRRPAWRVPLLAVSTVQFALHSLNHLLDIGKAHPAWLGYFDFATLSCSTLLLAWMWLAAGREASWPPSGAAALRKLRPSPLAERSST